MNDIWLENKTQSLCKSGQSLLSDLQILMKYVFLLCFLHEVLMILLINLH